MEGAYSIAPDGRGGDYFTIFLSVICRARYILYNKKQLATLILLNIEKIKFNHIFQALLMTMPLRL